jgi:hypothetical protein
MREPFGIIKGHKGRQAIALRADSNEITSGRRDDSRKHEPLGTLGLTTTRIGFGWVCLIYHQIQSRELVFMACLVCLPLSNSKTLRRIVECLGLGEIGRIRGV